MSELNAAPGAQALVSVVMPAYNSEQFIREALDSALAQDYSALEIIVVDDGSIDTTRELVQSYGGRVRLLTQANQGSAAARNLGIRNALGQYVAFLDADDVWLPNKISLQMRQMAASGAKMAYSRFLRWSPEGAGNYPAPLQMPGTSPLESAPAPVARWLYADLLMDCIVWTSTVIVEKTELEQAGLFDPQLRKGQDYDLWLKLSQSIQMVGVDQVTALYRIHPSSITGKVKEVNYEHLILARAVERWGEAGPDGRTPPPGLVTGRLAKSSFVHGFAHLKQGDPAIAAAAFRQSLRHSGFNAKALLYWMIASSRTWLRRT